MAKSGKPGKEKAGPFLLIAVLCENVLTEQDRVLSLIRVVDIISLPSAPPPPPGPGLAVALPLTMLIMLKPGDFRGQKELRIVQVNPSGVREETGRATFTFTGPDEGGVVSRSQQINLIWDKEGLYWYELVLGGTLLTRIPLRVNIVQPDASTPKPLEEDKPAPKRRRNV